MSAYAAPALFVVFVWWFSTGLLMMLVRRPVSTFGWSFAVTTAFAAYALSALSASSTQTAPTDAYVAFVGALVVWAWVEIAFLTGFVTGPERGESLKGNSEWARFWHASRTVIHHELMLVAAGLLIAAVTWGGENKTAIITFSALWALRLSAKLNLFLGVRFRGENLLPDHLRYLASHFGTKPINLLFPFSVSFSMIACVLFAEAAMASDASTFHRTAFTLVATLIALGALEHWFMLLPGPVSTLWGWAGDISESKPKLSAKQDMHDEPRLVSIVRSLDSAKLQAAAVKSAQTAKPSIHAGLLNRRRST